ncbi:MAG: biotin-dependent carboxyltransferase family protein [Desulfuromusa sp.]|nr:biotin-dependent carboxyltransferase family protein [Desulfuromusa sp.]
MSAELIVRKTGMLTSIQDLGRFGYRCYGVPWSGALHPDLARIANVLVGNPPDSAVLETLVTGPILEVTRGVLRIAVVGDALIEIVRAGQSRLIRSWRSVTLKAGDLFKVKTVSRGRAVYLAFSGGVSVPKVMGSRATSVRGRLGGIDGSFLSAGTSLTCSENAVPTGPELNLPVNPLDDIPYNHPRDLTSSFLELRVITGPQQDYFSEASLRDFFQQEYRIGPDSDRMGLRLEGKAVKHRSSAHQEIISDGMIPGAIQIPGNGLPIVMLADSPTVGGYPKIATVISCDLPKLAILSPRQRIGFRSVNVDQAETLLRQYRLELSSLLESVVPLTWLSDPFVETGNQGN